MGKEANASQAGNKTTINCNLSDQTTNTPVSSTEKSICDRTTTVKNTIQTNIIPGQTGTNTNTEITTNTKEITTNTKEVSSSNDEKETKEKVHFKKCFLHISLFFRKGVLNQMTQRQIMMHFVLLIIKTNLII